MAGDTKYFIDTMYQVVDGNIVYASNLNNPLAAIAAGLAVLGIDIQTGSSKYALDTGEVNAYAVSLNPAPTEYTEGLEVWLKTSNTNTGASTINVNSLGVIEIRRHGLEVLSAGDISSNYFTLLKYSSGYFQIVSASGRGEIAADEAEASAAIATASLAGAEAGAVTATEQAVIATAQAVIATAQAVIATTGGTTATEQAIIATNAAASIVLPDASGVAINTPVVVDGSGGWTLGTIGSNKNLLINSYFKVNQEAVSGTVVLAAGEYGHDMFKAGVSGCTYTFATVENKTTITISAGTLLQIIEGEVLQSGNISVSWGGTCLAKIDSGVEGVSGSVKGSVVGGTNVSIEFSTGTLSTPQVEYGEHSTPAEHRPDDFLQCARHFWTSGGAYILATPIYNSTTNLSRGVTILFPTAMRDTPDCTEVVDIMWTSSSTSYITTKSCRVTGTAANTTSLTGIQSFTADARL